MAKNFADLTLTEVLKALPYLADARPERYVYNLDIQNPDARVGSGQMWVSLDNGKVEFGEGHKAEDGVTMFQVLQGGLDTLIAFQVYGMKAATSAMLFGYVFTDNIKKAEAWFKILKIGKAEFVEALAKVGIEVGSTDLPIFGELGLE